MFLKSLGAEDITIRRVFLYQAAYLIGKGLFWGNLIGIGLAYLQLKTGVITLDPSSYYIKTVPVNLELTHILLLNAGTMAAIILMLLVPTTNQQDHSCKGDKVRLETQAKYGLLIRYRSDFQISSMHPHDLF